jgi:ABC-2 type transport system ATP-binding protein
MIRLEKLTKSFGRFTAVDGLDLHVRKGEVFGFLGPNGAGKTTTFKMVCGLMQPTSGSITIDGKDALAEPLRARRITGYIPDRPYLYDKLTADEFLTFIGGIYEIEAAERARRAGELLDFFDLLNFRGELIEGFSHGMKQRLTLASALLPRPPLLVVDEPMVGLDPSGARLIKEVFRRKADQGETVFLSTHTLEVAEEVCDRIAIIHKGRVVALGTMEELRETSRDGEANLESIFLSLTGGEEMQEVIQVLRS